MLEVTFRYRQLNIAILYYRIAEKLEHPRILGTSYTTCYLGLDFFFQIWVWFGLVWFDLVVIPSFNLLLCLELVNKFSMWEVVVESNFSVHLLSKP